MTVLQLKIIRSCDRETPSKQGSRANAEQQATGRILLKLSGVIVEIVLRVVVVREMEILVSAFLHRNTPLKKTINH
jgi:hypothetical protein